MCFFFVDLLKRHILKHVCKQFDHRLIYVVIADRHIDDVESFKV